MTARAVIEAIMAEVALDVPGVTYAVGPRECAATGAPPRVEWLPGDGAFQGPQRSGDNPRPLQNRWLTFHAKCWGADGDAAEALMEAVVRALHLTLTIGGYRVQGEGWVAAAQLSEGDAVILQLQLGLPVLDRVQPTVGAPSPDLIVSGGFE